MFGENITHSIKNLCPENSTNCNFSFTSHILTFGSCPLSPVAIKRPSEEKQSVVRVFLAGLIIKSCLKVFVS